MHYFIMLQGGLIALHVAILKQELFAGLILSSPAAETDPKVAGWFTVSLLCTYPDLKCHIDNLLAWCSSSCWWSSSSIGNQVH